MKKPRKSKNRKTQEAQAALDRYRNRVSSFKGKTKCGGGFRRNRSNVESE
jgi:hypothetical protein